MLARANGYVHVTSEAVDYSSVEFPSAFRARNGVVSGRNMKTVYCFSMKALYR